MFAFFVCVWGNGTGWSSGEVGKLLVGGVGD